ncbi:HNH endonuclease [Clostridium sp. ATCC 25772]|uniref:HNH endonuclease n=1 Tax=Clostridium sp. ATCC 25772 TaxID=1676991 RepID=UPI000781670D|nr:HNH endonuclease [Clostridium sp. ATCC 25772]
MIDLILEKIMLNKRKGIDSNLLMHILVETKNYNEVKSIINNLNLWDKKIKLGMSYIIIFFIEDYNDARRIFKNFNNFRNTKSTKIRHSLRYLNLLEIANKDEEVEDIVLEMNDKEIPKSIAFYIKLIEKQKNYKNARKIFENNIFLTEKSRINQWTRDDIDDGLKEVYGIMYLKAKEENEINQIVSELKSFNMSTNIADYQYLKEKSYVRRIECLKKQILNNQNHKKILIDYITESKYCTDERLKKFYFKNSERIMQINTVYKRDRTLVEYIKDFYSNTCQICGQKIDLGDKFYSEVHHIKPLYLGGPDVLENMIVVCPNHHVRLDKGGISIDLNSNVVEYLNLKRENIILIKHNISNEYIEFHNKYINNKNNNFNLNLK